MVIAVAAAIWLRLRGTVPPNTGRSVSISAEFAQVTRIGRLPALRGVICLAFVSFAILIGIRGVWSGPWLMDVRGLTRIDAGNVMLGITIMLIVMPMLISIIDRKTKSTRALLIGGHLVVGAALLLLPLGSTFELPLAYDLTLLILFGISISVQPLLFALGRQSVAPSDTGKALAAVNLAFFAGAAAIQGLSAPVATMSGVSGVIAFLGILSVLGALLFSVLSSRDAG